MPTSGIRDNHSGLPPPPVDHAGSTLSCLAFQETLHQLLLHHPVVPDHASLSPRQPPWSVSAAFRSCKRHHVILSHLLFLACTRGARPPLACTRITQSPLAQASDFSPPLAFTRGTPPSKNPNACMFREIPMAIHPSSSCPPQQWHLASPEGPDLLLGSLYCGILVSSPSHTTPLPMAHHSLASQAVLTQSTLVFSLELTSRVQFSKPSPHLIVSGWGVLGGGADDLCSSYSTLPSSVQLLHFSWWL